MVTARKLPCQVERIIDHGEHVYTVDLRPECLVPRFHSGQFLHLALDEFESGDFWPDSRVFSIANSPVCRERLRISYSVRGRFTGRMERELEEGRQVWIKLPYGEFTIQDTRDVVLFAGGTGITAFTAFIDGLMPDFEHQVSLFYGARSESLLIYQELTSRIAARGPCFRVFYFVEHITDQSLVGLGSSLIVGQLSVASAWPVLRDPFDADYYLSGPPLMLKALTEDLLNRGVELESIKVDAWE